jgi:hypothetical protein
VPRLIVRNAFNINVREATNTRPLGSPAKLRRCIPNILLLNAKRGEGLWVASDKPSATNQTVRGCTENRNNFLTPNALSAMKARQAKPAKLLRTWSSQSSFIEEQRSASDRRLAERA